jgi:predicted nucleic acid-binding protein
MSDKGFLDTNVLIYALAKDDPRRSCAEELLAAGGVISVQVLNEFVSVARRKLQMSWEQVTEALDAIRILCPSPVPITIDTHESALKIAQQYGYGFYDALMVETAIEGRCSTVYSEDWHDGQIIDGQLTVRNPFRHSK